MTATTDNRELRALVQKALNRAYCLGQTYWQQADSEHASQWKKADETRKSFDALCDETIALLTRTEADAAAPVADGAVACWAVVAPSGFIEEIAYSQEKAQSRAECIGRGWTAAPMFTHPQDASAGDAEDALLRIAEFAHRESSGPEVEDDLWTIRNMAVEALDALHQPAKGGAL